MQSSNWQQFPDHGNQLPTDFASLHPLLAPSQACETMLKEAQGWQVITGWAQRFFPIGVSRHVARGSQC
jgi:hypothetical protein